MPYCGVLKTNHCHIGKLTIVALGPLTNLAMAVKLKPEIKTYIKEIYILGGNMDGLGNTTAAAEFNFYVDPESAAICLDSYPPCKLIILPWETALKATSTLVRKKYTLFKTFVIITFANYHCMAINSTGI